jgi:hypothetical protein
MTSPTGERAVASFLPAVLTEIYLCASCSCHEILRSATARLSSKCKEFTEATKQIELWRLPPVRAQTAVLMMRRARHVPATAPQ